MSNELSTPLVCICIPVYNAEKTIKATLTSILNQTYQNIEVRVVDNCSTDDSLAIVRSFDDARLKIFENDQNIGGEKNFSRCIQLSVGDYTAIYHADDLYEPDMVEKQVQFMQENPDVGAVFTEAKLIDSRSSKIGYFKLPKSFIKDSNTYDFNEIFKGILKHSTFLFCPSAMVRTRIYKSNIVEWRGDQFGSSADLDVWFRIAKEYPVGIIPIPLLNYRISNLQFSSQVRRDTQQADFFKVIDFYLKQPFVKEIITTEDIFNFNSLERRERVMRAANLFILGNATQAKSLCNDVFSMSAIRAAFKNKRGKLTILLGSMIKLSIWLHMEKIGKWLIQGLIVLLNK